MELAQALVYARSWRWCYYVFILVDGIGLGLAALCYFPPNFRQLHPGRTKIDLLKKLDYLGITLYSCGVVLFLMGVSWGGGMYPWRSAPVITTLVLGVLILAIFMFWGENFPSLIFNGW